VPRANDLAQLNERKNVNYVKENHKKAVYDMKPPMKAEKDDHKTVNKNYGKVPNYINKFQKEKEDELKRIAIQEEAAKHPPGTRLMPEDERISTLNDLKQAREETSRALEKLPVVAHSNKMERHKKEMEEKLNRLDRAI
jgi:hypothetical protein